MAGGRVLIVSWDGGGNFPPALALAARLTDAGHEVAVMTDAAAAERVAASGAQLVEYASVEPWPEGVTFEDDPVRFAEMRNGAATARDVLSAAAEFLPDVMVVDCMAGAGLVASELLGLPTAVLVHVLYQPFVCAWADLSVDVSACRAAFGLDPLGSPAYLDQLKQAAKVLVLMPEELDYPGAPRTDETHYVGPILQPRVPPPADDLNLGFDPGDDRPLVLVSLSTTYQRQEEALPPILDALDQLPVRGLLTLGGIDLGQRIPASQHVVVRDHVPHDSILGQVSAVVCHAGLSTILASLARGVPLVCIPQGREQPLNAERIQACGAGIDLPSDASPQAIAEALSAVLDQPSYKNAATDMASLIEHHGAGANAAEQVAALIRQSKAGR